MNPVSQVAGLFNGCDAGEMTTMGVVGLLHFSRYSARMNEKLLGFHGELTFIILEKYKQLYMFCAMINTYSVVISLIIKLNKANITDNQFDF